jgi:hypothetical protein
MQQAWWKKLDAEHFITKELQFLVVMESSL